MFLQTGAREQSLGSVICEVGHCNVCSEKFRFLFREGARGASTGRAPQGPQALLHLWPSGLPREVRPSQPYFRGSCPSGPPKDTGATAPNGSHLRGSNRPRRSVPTLLHRAAGVLLPFSGDRMGQAAPFIRRPVVTPGGRGKHNRDVQAIKNAY